MKKIFIIIFLLFLFSCEKNVEKQTEPKTKISEKVKQEEKNYFENTYLINCRNSKCYTQTIGNMKNDFLKKCILENINLNKKISEKLKNDNLEKAEFISIKNLEEECIYHNEVLKSKEIPIFTDFLEKEFFLIEEKKEIFFGYYLTSEERKNFYFGDGSLGGWEKYNEKMQKQREDNIKKYGEIEEDFSEKETKYLLEKAEADEYLKNFEKDKEDEIKKSKKIYIINNHYLKTRK